MSTLEIVQSVLIVTLFVWNVSIVNGANRNTAAISAEFRRIRSRLPR